MVLTWNQEPSKDLARSNLSPPKPRAPAAVFYTTPRFVRDGTSRVQNFLNGHDTQHLEIPPARRAHVDTSTHTTWAERLTGADGGVTTLVDALNKSLFSAAALRSNRPKSATPQSHVANDTRYAHIHDPYDNSLGPGSFSLDLAKPPVGTLPPETPGAGAVPAKDPFRRSAAFMSPDRPSSASWVRAFGPDVIHSSPDYKPSQDFSVAFHRQKGRNTDDVRDWRYSLRLHDDKRDASPEAEMYESAAEWDQAGRPARVAVAASARNTAAASFMSKEARFARLPNSRSNDNRIGRQRYDEVTYTNLGPGAYLPLTSIGGAKRSTYRLYQMPTEQQPQRRPIRRSSSAQPSAQQRAGSPLNTARSGQSGTVPFTSTFRGQKYGPHEWSRDSTLLRTR